MIPIYNPVFPSVPGDHCYHDTADTETCYTIPSNDKKPWADVEAACNDIVGLKNITGNATIIDVSVTQPQSRDITVVLEQTNCTLVKKKTELFFSNLSDYLQVNILQLPEISM